MIRKAFIKDLVPPLLWDAAKSIAGRETRLKAFPSWEIAAKHGEGHYDSKNGAIVVARKTRAILSNPDASFVRCTDTFLAAGVAGLSPETEQCLKVLDFGGSVGIHYFITKRFFPRIRFDWRVVEAPGIIEVATEFQNPELKFFPTIESALNGVRTLDLIHSSCALQFLADEHSILDRLLSIPSRGFILNRMAVHDGRSDLVTLFRYLISQSGRAAPIALDKSVGKKVVSFPMRFLPEAGLIAKLGAAYQVQFSFVDPTDSFIISGRNTKSICWSGLRRGEK